MKNNMYNLEFRIKHKDLDVDAALIELESYVRDADSALDVSLLCSAEIVAPYQTYEKLRQAACLVRDAMNELYVLNGNDE